MKNIKISFFVVLIFLTTNSFAQSFSFDRTIGKFKSATSFYITSAGIIYVTDSGTNEIYKLDTLGNVLNYAGGFGWSGGQFDTPSDVFANPLSVYVCDKNNSRVERFDKDLNYISSLYTRDSDTSAARFGYPLSCALSQQGDLYILDSENKRVLKFDLFGNFVQNFGGYEAGAYALIKPKQLAISPDNKIFVEDEKRIVVFDQYGNNVAIIKDNENFEGIRIIFNNMTLNDSVNVYYSNLNHTNPGINKLKLSGYNNLHSIINSLIFGDKLYILTPENILIFKA